MGLYSILLFFFLIGAIGITVINRKSKSIPERQNRWVKYFVYFGLVFGQLFLIDTKQYEYLTILIVLVGLYEIFKIKKSIKTILFALPVYVFISLFFVLFFKGVEVKLQQFLFVIVITFDGYSQLSGQLFGKTKLFPTISPNKTLEGLFGGIVSTLIIAIILSEVLDIQTTKAILFGLMISWCSVAGDFLASFYKRINGVKDYSRIIQQHGGFLDRFDSLMFAGFGFYFLLKLDSYTPLTSIFIGYTVLFLLIFLMAEILYHSLKCKVEISRKFVHITSGITCLSFPFYINNHWMVLSLCSGFILILFVSKQFNLLQSINAIDRKSYGSLLFPVAVYFCFLSFVYFNHEYIYFYLPILILSICDPLAALIGKKWAYGKYKVGKDYKTIVGSSAFFVSCFVILFLAIHFSLEQKSVLLIFTSCTLISIGTTFTEAFSRKGFDNLTIPLTVLLGLFFSSACFSQNSVASTPLKTRVISFSIIPVNVEKVNGLSISINNIPDQNAQVFNGINLELVGAGWITPFIFLDNSHHIENTKCNHIINGLSLGATLLNGKVNGLSVAPLLNTTYSFNGMKCGLINVDFYQSNGLQIGLLNFNLENINGVSVGFYNQAANCNGIQIGLFNRSTNLRGLQFGLWNTNGKRKLPLVNWQFKA